MDKHQKQAEIHKYEKFMHWLWRQKSITELVLNVGMDGIAKKYVKERVSADSSHEAPAALPLQNVNAPLLPEKEEIKQAFDFVAEKLDGNLDFTSMDYFEQGVHFCCNYNCSKFYNGR